MTAKELLDNRIEALKVDFINLRKQFELHPLVESISFMHSTAVDDGDIIQYLETIHINGVLTYIYYFPGYLEIEDVTEENINYLKGLGLAIDDDTLDTFLEAIVYFVYSYDTQLEGDEYTFTREDFSLRKARTIVPFKEVKIGDRAYYPEAGDELDEQYEGEIIWKGSIEELRKSEYKNLIDGTFEVEDEYPPDNYNWVVVRVPGDNFNIGGITVYNYDGDPSGVVTYKKD